MSCPRVLSCSPIVRIAPSARPLLAELCRGELTTTTVSGIFTFFVAAHSELPNEQILSRSLPLSLQGSLWLLLSLTRSLACMRCSSRRPPVMLPERYRHPPSSARACLPAKSTVMMSLSSRFNGVSLAWGGSMPRHKMQVSHHGALRGLCVQILSVRRVPACFFFVRLGLLHSPSHVVVCPAKLLPSVDVQALVSPGRDATSVFSSSTLVLVTLAIAFAHVPGEELSKYPAEDP